MSMCRVFLCCRKRMFAMTNVFSWQNSISLCPASFCTPRPNLPVTRGVSWLPTFEFQSPIIAKFRLKWKKKGKTTRPFRYDLNQIPYDYTVEVRNRFKGLDLIDRVPDELWTEICDIVQRQESRLSPKKGNAKKQNGCLRSPYR